MDKPITIVREELRSAVTNLVNQSKLPAFVVADMFEGFVVELRNLEREQLVRDQEEYANRVEAE